MNESSYLTVLKILVDEVILSKPSIERSDSLIIGSLTQLHSFLAYVKSRDYDADQFKNHEKEYLAKIIHWHLHFVEKSNAYMTVETKDCLQQLQKMFTLGRNDVLRYNAEISVEIEKLNKIRIKDDVSLLDVCTSDPKKRYHLLKNSEFWPIINSKRFEKEFPHLSQTIKPYIISCFVRKLFTDIGLKYLMLLSQDKLPSLCCENLVQYLSNEDILYLCQIYTNKI
ncbi:hypothetical protein TKK_0008413 [Trichogramma kaykai]